MYALGPVRLHTAEFHSPKGLSESEIWSSHVRPVLEGVPKNVIAICEYGFTEILNNLIDHSESTFARINVKRTPDLLELEVVDLGVGIFAKIQKEFHLPSVKETVLELTKGKLTTDPMRHTGEGIFFTSRMFDEFEIYSGGVFLSHTAKDLWVVEGRTARSGTLVTMKISPHSRRTPQSVFDQFAGGSGEFEFKKTHIMLRVLGAEGQRLVSRSQAKRVLARLESFTDVILNFEGIRSVGPAFADEIFRVFARSHPEVKITPMKANLYVQRMIRRALAAAGSEKGN